MDIWRISKDSVLKVKDKTADKIVFSLRDSEEFNGISICLELKLNINAGKELKVTYSVKNKDRKKMYFGIGDILLLSPWKRTL